MQEKDNLKIAITHDYLTEYGGAEMVLWEILKTFPQADLFIPILKPTSKQRAFWLEVEKHKVTKSFISNLPLPKTVFKFLLPLQIRFFKKLDLSKYNLVISSSAGFSKFINVSGKTKHIAYIHTPPRFLWGFDTALFHKIPWIIKFMFSPLVSKWRRQDRKFAQAADLLLANSKNIQDKIKEIYNRDSQIVYPPVDIANIINSKPTKKADYFLTIGRLYAYKKIDLVVGAFKTLDEQLVVIGDGPQRRQLEKLAGRNIEFRGFVDEDVKIDLLKKAKGFVFAADEDFGIVMVEALAASTPVIAFGKGGATEIVKNGKNGILFSEQTVSSLKEAVKLFKSSDFDVKLVKKSAQKFSSENFRNTLQKLVSEIP